MALWELLILALWIPLCWFGSMWLFRVLAGFAVAKIGAATLQNIKGESDKRG